MFKMSILIAIAFICLAAPCFSQQVEFNYNGRVEVESQPFNGEGHFKFSLINKDGSVTYWANDGISLNGTQPQESVTAPVNDGFFSINIGDHAVSGMAPLDATVFNEKDPVWLRVWFSDGENGFEKLSPDRRITNPALLGGRTYSDLILYVDCNLGDDKNSGLRADKAKKTISAAVSILPQRIENNATINVAPGIYREQVVICGYFVFPGKQLLLKGNSSWTIQSPSDPTVRITGADSDISKTPIRKYGIYVEQCSGIAIEGFLVDYTGSDGIAFKKVSSSFLKSCKTNKCGRPTGISFGNSDVMCQELITINGAHHGIRSDQSRVGLKNIISTGNSDSGIYSNIFSVLILEGSIVSCSNGFRGLYATNASQILFGDVAGQYNNNGAYGIEADTCSYLYGSTNFTATGNLAAPTYFHRNAWDFTWKIGQAPANIPVQISPDTAMPILPRVPDPQTE